MVVGDASLYSGPNMVIVRWNFNNGKLKDGGESTIADWVVPYGTTVGLFNGHFPDIEYDRNRYLESWFRDFGEIDLDGWFDETTGTEYSLDTAITHDVTLTAH